MACVTSLSSLAQRKDVLLVDKSIHASLWDGVRLSGADVERFTHEDMRSLEALFTRLPPEQPKIIVVDGVYSMEGHVASLPEIVRLAQLHRAFVVVDDCHGFGVLGREGRGVADHFGLTDEVELITGSFSKSLASTGGFVAGDVNLARRAGWQGPDPHGGQRVAHARNAGPLRRRVEGGDQESRLQATGVGGLSLT